MNESFQLKSRGIQILNLLKQNGPLSFRGLKEMIKPEIKDRRLHSSLARLSKNGLVKKRHEKVFRGAGVYYQLVQNILARERLALVLGCSSKDVHQSFFRSRELMHTEACALWADRLQRLFPDAKIVREFEFYNTASAHEILLTHKNDSELLPDLLLTFDGASGLSKVFIAVEIERCRKSKTRLINKLRKYADETALDGVIYFCDDSEVSEPVKSIYNRKIGHKSIRVSHYADYFILFSDDLHKQIQSNTQMLNASNSSVSLTSWINHLRQVPLTSRRSKNFEVGAGSCSHFENAG
jgi:hypothetical protein